MPERHDTRTHSVRPDASAAAPPRLRIGPWLPEGAIPDVDGNYLTFLGGPDGLLEAICWNKSKSRAVWQKHADHGMRFAPILRDEPRGDTVRVRVAVAAEDRETWSAWGLSGCTDDGMIEEAGDAGRGYGFGSMDSARVSFIEADVLLPDAPRTVEGEVMP